MSCNEELSLQHKKWNILNKMTSRKFAEGGRSKPNIQENEVRKSSNEEKKSPRRSDGFFIKPSNKNKKNIASHVTLNSKEVTLASQKESFPRKVKQPLPSQAGDKTPTKALFDKKAWRFKRYSKKYKLEQWKDVRKTHILRGFDKTLGENHTTNFKEEQVDHADDTTKKESSPDKQPSLLDDDSNTNNTEQKFTKLTKKSSLFHQSKLNKRNQDEEEINIKKTENLKRKAAKEQAIKEYKRKKTEKFKKLSRKTKKGQPVMKDRIEVLLEEIQNSIGH